MESLFYTWDTIPACAGTNLLSRDDPYNTVAENFCYNDGASGANVLNRLTNSSLGGSGSDACTNGSNPKTIAYDNDGDITSKSDIPRSSRGTTYTYGGTNQAGPHAVTAIATNPGMLVDGVANPTLIYQLDGLLKCVTSGTDCSTAARSYGWTSFDPRLRGGRLVSSITQGADTETVAYDPDHDRGALTDSSSGDTTWYFSNPAAGAMSELLQGSTESWRDYMMAYGHIVAERFDTAGTPSVYYFVGDHLTSTTTLTDANQNQKEYDAGACPPAAPCADLGTPSRL
jgi:hypothetical protein